MGTTKKELVRRLKPGDKVRWSAETNSVQTDPSTVETVHLDGETTDLQLSGSRGGEYRIRLDEMGGLYVSSVYSDGTEESHGEIKWISLVAGEKFRQ